MWHLRVKILAQIPNQCVMCFPCRSRLYIWGSDEYPEASVYTKVVLTSSMMWVSEALLPNSPALWGSCL